MQIQDSLFICLTPDLTFSKSRQLFNCFALEQICLSVLRLSKHRASNIMIHFWNSKNKMSLLSCDFYDSQKWSQLSHSCKGQVAKKEIRSDEFSQKIIFRFPSNGISNQINKWEYTENHWAFHWDSIFKATRMFDYNPPVWSLYITAYNSNSTSNNGKYCVTVECKILSIKKCEMSIYLILKFNMNEFKHFTIFKEKWESQRSISTISSIRGVEIKTLLTQSKNKRKYNFNQVSLSKRKPHHSNESLKMCALRKAPVFKSPLALKSLELVQIAIISADSAINQN